MAIIKPISDLRNHFNTISDICHNDAEPVYITKNGKGDMVVMSLALYEKEKMQLELYKKLLVAEKQSSETHKQKSHKDLMKDLMEKINAKDI